VINSSKDVSPSGVYVDNVDLVNYFVVPVSCQNSNFTN